MSAPARRTKCAPPAEIGARLAGIADEKIDFRRAEITRIDLDIVLPVEADKAEGAVEEIGDRPGLAGGDDVIFGFLLRSISHMAST